MVKRKRRARGTPAQRFRKLKRTVEELTVRLIKTAARLDEVRKELRRLRRAQLKRAGTAAGQRELALFPEEAVPVVDRELAPDPVAIVDAALAARVLAEPCLTCDVGPRAECIWAEPRRGLPPHGRFHRARLKRAGQTV